MGHYQFCFAINAKCPWQRTMEMYQHIGRNIVVCLPPHSTPVSVCHVGLILKISRLLDLCTVISQWKVGSPHIKWIKHLTVGQSWECSSGASPLAETSPMAFMWSWRDESSFSTRSPKAFSCFTLSWAFRVCDPMSHFSFYSQAIMMPTDHQNPAASTSLPSLLVFVCGPVISAVDLRFSCLDGTMPNGD